MSDLGQVFTKVDVADYMVSLFDLGVNAALLDPCHGDGAFLKALKSKGFKDITAYEIDMSLYTSVKELFPEFKLVNKDFLKLKGKELYDGIIMNPPYVRQEKIDELSYLGITKGRLRKDKIYAGLPSTANLYMYFIVKAIELLKESGELVVIFPSSWMKARSGEGFKKLIFAKCSLVQEVHITGAVFEKEALVEVVILKLVKGNSKAENKIQYLTVNDGNFDVIQNHQAKHLNFSLPFSEFATIKRGMTTGCNSMYINPGFIQNESIEFLKPIISSPKSIDGYSIQNAKTDLIFIPRNVESQPKEIEAYLKKWKKKILQDKKPKTLYEKIVSGTVWYELREIDGEGILFSYFVRNDMKFIMNNTSIIARDNFYVIKPKIDLDIMFALLNNYYTFYQMEMYGKKYGAGLLKLQRYDVEALKFPDYERISDEHRKELKEMALLLIKTSNTSYVEKITKIVEQYSSITYDEIKKMYFDIKKKRLEVTTNGN